MGDPMKVLDKRLRELQAGGGGRTGTPATPPRGGLARSTSLLAALDNPRRPAGGWHGQSVDTWDTCAMV